MHADIDTWPLPAAPVPKLTDTDSEAPLFTHTPEGPWQDVTAPSHHTDMSWNPPAPELLVIVNHTEFPVVNWGADAVPP
jgi:hypothetical protein